MNAEEIENVLEMVMEAKRLVPGVRPSEVIAQLNAIWTTLDQHRLVMEAAETSPAKCYGCGVELCGHGRLVCPACCDAAESKPVTAGQIRDAELRTPTIESTPTCGKCDVPMGNDIDPLCPACHEQMQATVPVPSRLDAIEKRLTVHKHWLQRIDKTTKGCNCQHCGILLTYEDLLGCCTECDELYHCRCRRGVGQ